MINKIVVTNPTGNSLELDLRMSGEIHNILIFSIKGLGPPKATVNARGGPGFDGTRVNSVTTDARNIVITLAINVGGSKETVAREKIYKYFPIKQRISFEVVTDTKRLQTFGYVEDNESNIFATTENFVISLYCNDPYLYDVLLREVIVYGEGRVGTFSFPFSNNSLTQKLLKFGDILGIPAVNVAYSGQVTTGLDIALNMLTGGAEDVTIRNSNHDQAMYLNFDGAAAFFGGPPTIGDQVFINTRVGHKQAWYVRNAVWYNMFNGVALGSNWIQLYPGGNLLSVEATTGIDNLETLFQWYPKMEGV